jgi:hypothetical protein
MRHSKIDLTMNVYTDPKLLDVWGALDSLPVLPLDADTAEMEVLRATGTAGDTDVGPSSVAPPVAPTWCNRSDSQSSPVKIADLGNIGCEAPSVSVTSSPVKSKAPLTSPVNGARGLGAKGFEPLTPSVSTSIGKFHHSPPTSIDHCCVGVPANRLSTAIARFPPLSFALATVRLQWQSDDPTHRQGHLTDSPSTPHDQSDRISPSRSQCRARCFFMLGVNKRSRIAPCRTLCASPCHLNRHFATTDRTRTSSPIRRRIILAGSAARRIR